MHDRIMPSISYGYELITHGILEGSLIFQVSNTRYLQCDFKRDIQAANSYKGKYGRSSRKY